GTELGAFEAAFEASHLRGPHNRANTACAIAVVRALGGDESGADCAVRECAAPPHRLEQVRELRGVRYVNDSKATNVEATLQALASFDAPLHVSLWCAGQSVRIVRRPAARDPRRLAQGSRLRTAGRPAGARGLGRVPGRRGCPRAAAGLPQLWH